MSAALFQQFRKAISVQNAGDISTSYLSITTRLNKDFWETESDVRHCRQVGSYGRNTAIHGISDLDMLFELPWSVYSQYDTHDGNGQSKLLQAVKDSIQERYRNTKVRADGQVVVIEFKKYEVEVVPVFYDAKADEYTYPDTNNGGCWKISKPHKEIAAMNDRNTESNRNLKHACKMVRSWKNQVGSPISGWLIDTLCHNFFGQTSKYNTLSYASYPELVAELFEYLGSLPEQDYWLAPGSRQQVPAGDNFRPKAKKAGVRARDALAADTDAKKIKLWRQIFGHSFPKAVEGTQRTLEATQVRTTEEFIEDKYSVDIKYSLKCDCEVTDTAGDKRALSQLAKIFFWLPVGRSLRFYVESFDVPPPFELKWKVRNVGPLAKTKGIRGQILEDEGKYERRETTRFHGEHYVECYAIKNDVCVARTRVEVPIENTP